MAEQLDRRRFLGYLVAAPTLAVAVGWTAALACPQAASAAVPSLPQPEEIFDLGDMQDLAAAPTSGLITVVVNEDGTASLAVPRAEVGQGMTTAIAMMVITGPNGQTASYGELATPAATRTTLSVAAQLKAESAFAILGAPQGRIDARDIVTGRKQFTTDLQVPGAKPTMVARPPTVNGTVVSVNNEGTVLAMPGVTDVATLAHGVAIRAEAFGQCIDAIQMIDVTWGPGTVDGQSDDTVEAQLKAALPGLATPLSLLAESVDAEFFFAFASNSPLEPDCAIADVRPGSAEIWSSLKAPVVAQGEIAAALGLPVSAVTIHVTEGGGSFGRHLFHDAALEAAEAAQKMGKPVKLSWSRTDNFRQGRTHPMCVSRVRASCALGNVLTYEQRHTSVQTEFGHGLGDMVTATASKLPVAGGLALSQTIFELTQSSAYNFGVTVQALNEIPLQFNTGSMRNIYSPNVVCAQELIVDQLANKMGQDPLRFRRNFLKDERLLAVLNKAAEAGDWGKAMPPQTAQGIAVHSEYQGAIAVLAEIDCTPATVNRPITDGVTGPRVTKALVVIDAGFAINPRGLEAQMIGGVQDGIALALTSSLHIADGIPLEGSWDNYFYTREWNTPLDVEVIVMPDTSDSPSGAGELGVAPTMAAVACAYARATGTLPTRFPINYGTLGFTPLPLEPSTPQSPTNGLDSAF
jgi:isoquinoline 1-oxidoreductase beta subunit